MLRTVKLNNNVKQTYSVAFSKLLYNAKKIQKQRPMSGKEEKKYVAAREEMLKHA